MKLLIVLTVAALSCAAKLRTPHPFSQEAINRINSIQSLWVAGKTFKESDWPWVRKISNGVTGTGPTLPRKHIRVLADIPAEFDARKKWPTCPTIGHIRDQANCGSCWAHGTAESISDRICIKSGGKLNNVQISSEDLMTCSDAGDCDGGMPDEVFNWWVSHGIVTGGDYNTSVGCKPYSVPHCEHFNITGKYPKCGPYEPTPPCTKKCLAAYGKTYEQDMHFGASSNSIGGNVQEIQTEVLSNGPVAAVIDVYDDFPNYKSGVYIRTSDNMLGGHVVKILGWGVEKSVDYWLVANSWGADFGANGYIKIRRGTDEIGIEDWITFGEPKF